MTDSKIVHMDENTVRARAAARKIQADLRYVKVASVKMTTRLGSDEAKQLFTRCFGSVQRNAYFISAIARSRLKLDEVARVEMALRESLILAADELNKAIDEAEELFKTNGITRIATYDTVLLEVEVGIVSSNGRRYFEVLHKLDQLIPMLQTLVVNEVTSPEEAAFQRARYRRLVRKLARHTRSIADSLRRRMNALDGGDDLPEWPTAALSQNRLHQSNDAVRSIGDIQVGQKREASPLAQTDDVTDVVADQETGQERLD